MSHWHWILTSVRQHKGSRSLVVDDKRMRKGQWFLSVLLAFFCAFVTVDWMTGLKSKTNLCHCILFWKKWRKLTEGDQANRFLCKMAVDKFLSYYSIICVVCMQLLITICTLYVWRTPYCGTIFPKFSVSFSMQFVTTLVNKSIQCMYRWQTKHCIRWPLWVDVHFYCKSFLVKNYAVFVITYHQKAVVFCMTYWCGLQSELKSS